MKTRICRGFTSCLLAMGLGMGHAGAVDLTVAHVEVTQGIQTANNTVPLVAQRSIAVRATVGVADSTGSVSPVTGRLHVFVNGVAITPADGLLPIPSFAGDVELPFRASLVPNRRNQLDTLNFELLAPTGIPASTDVDFRVDIVPVAGETNAQNNSGSVNNLTFVPRRTPLLRTVRVIYPPGGLGIAPEDPIRRGTGDALVRAVYPINDGDPTLYDPDRIPPILFNEDANGNGRIETNGADGQNLLAALSAARQLIVDDGIGAIDRRFLHGWLAGNPFANSEGDPVNGFALISGRVGCLNTDPELYQGTFAHELGHNFGFLHPDQTNPPGPRQIDEVGWDVGARLFNNPVENGVTASVLNRAKRASLFDFMEPGLPTESRWIHPGHYTDLLNHPTLIPDPREAFFRRVLVIIGTMDRTGITLIKFWPVFRFPWLSQPTRIVDRPATLPFLARVQTVSGRLIAAPFNARIAGDGEKGRESFGFFEVMVPVEEEVRSIRITDRAGGKLFGKMDRSPVAPRLRVLAPTPGGRLNRNARVTWQVEDPDTPASQLMYQVAYSPDNGNSFVPLGVNLTKTEHTFDATQIPRSQRSGLIRIFASDGLNTSFADVGGLSTP